MNQRRRKNLPARDPNDARLRRTGPECTDCKRPPAFAFDPMRTQNTEWVRVVRLNEPLDFFLKAIHRSSAAARRLLALGHSLTLCSPHPSYWTAGRRAKQRNT